MSAVGGDLKQDHAQEPQLTSWTITFGNAQPEKGSNFFKPQPAPSYAPAIELLKEREKECREAIADTQRESELIASDLQRAHRQVVELKRKLNARDEFVVERQDELKALYAARTALESLAADDTRLVQA